MLETPLQGGTQTSLIHTGPAKSEHTAPSAQPEVGVDAAEAAGRPNAVLSVVTSALAPATATCRISVGRLPKLSKAVDAAVVCEHTTHDCQSRGPKP